MCSICLRCNTLPVVVTKNLMLNVEAKAHLAAWLKEDLNTCPGTPWSTDLDAMVYQGHGCSRGREVRVREVSDGGKTVVEGGRFVVGGGVSMREVSW